jgi:hypothetical protein
MGQNQPPIPFRAHRQSGRFFRAAATRTMARPPMNFFRRLMVRLAAHSRNLEVFEDPRDGHKYKLMEIGGQVWFAENLAYMPHVSSCNQDGGIWVNGYNWKDVSAAKKVNNYNEYGCLYDFRSAQLSCPDGWRLPTRVDFKNLLNLAGGVEYNDRVKVYRSLGPGGRWDSTAC